MPGTKKDIISQLRKDILLLEGYKPTAEGQHKTLGLGPLEEVFPNGVFPTGTVHEMVCSNTEQAAACGGFVTGLLSVLMKEGGICLWVSLSGNLHPAALKSFNIEPDKIIFVNLTKDKDVLWVMEEALKCTGLAAVIGEVKEVDFKQSRRLQLAVEQSRVTGFILRNELAKMGATASAARWKIKPLPSEAVDGLPGLGFPRWQVELLRVRNGQTGSWIMEWTEGWFITVAKPVVVEQQQLMAG
jgi:protein ImuA